MNTPVGSNVGVRTILILLPRILIFWKGFLVQLPDNRSWLGSKGGHCEQLHQRGKGHWLEIGHKAKKTFVANMVMAMRGNEETVLLIIGN